jgi:hypothetical protein
VLHLVFFLSRIGFDEDSYMEFSKTVQDKIVGTSDKTAHVSKSSTPYKFLKILLLFNPKGKNTKTKISNLILKRPSEKKSFFLNKKNK